VGPLLLLHTVLAHLGIGQIVDRLARVRGSALLLHREVIEALVVNRLRASHTWRRASQSFRLPISFTTMASPSTEMTPDMAIRPKKTGSMR
jgi:hypothetical protein